MTKRKMDKSVMPEQLDNIRHSLGLTYNKTPYRNYFFVYEPDPSWEDLVAKGYAKRFDKPDGIYYTVSPEGKKLVGVDNVKD